MLPPSAARKPTRLTPSARASTNAAGRTTSTCSPASGSPISIANPRLTMPSPAWSLRFSVCDHRQVGLEFLKRNAALKPSVAQPFADFRLHRKYIGGVFRVARVQLVSLFFVGYDHPEAGFIQGPKVTFHHSLQTYDPELRDVDQRMKYRSQRRLPIEQRHIDERNRRHVGRIRHDACAAGANSLVKWRVWNRLAGLGQIL